MFLAILFGLLCVAVYLLYQNYNYWKQRGIEGPKPTWFLGTIKQCLKLKRSLMLYYNDVYDQFPDQPYVGIYKVFTPTLVVRDPEIVKDIMVRNFQHFTYNDFEVDPHKDPLIGLNPFILRDEEWKKKRTETVRCFTASKIKAWFPLLEDVSKELVEYVEKTPQPIEAKNTCMKFTLSNVASCAFGFNPKCFDGKTEFEYLAQNILSQTASVSMFMFLNQIFPLLRHYIKLKLTPKDVENRLIQIVKENVKSRLENNIIRNDFLQTILDLKKNERNDKNFETDITAHAAGFIIDGYESSSTAMSFFLYNVASNKDIQEKLRKEINEKIEKYNGELNYDCLQDMEYLDAALSESLRMYPILATLTKICTKDYVNKDLKVERGTSIAIPALKLQNDPKYWDEPEKFKPERFLKENKDHEKHGIYLAFGEGPRMCIGMRFGSIQVKLGVAHLIRNFDISVNSKTKQPLQFDPVYFILAVDGGAWLDFKKIPIVAH